MYFINPRGTLCFSKTVGSIKNVQSFRFQHFNPAHPAAGHGNFQNPICAAAELELGEIGSGLGICPVRSQRERELLTSPPRVSAVLHCVSGAGHECISAVSAVTESPGHPVRS